MPRDPWSARCPRCRSPALAASTRRSAALRRRAATRSPSWSCVVGSGIHAASPRRRASISVRTSGDVASDARTSIRVGSASSIGCERDGRRRAVEVERHRLRRTAIFVAGRVLKPHARHPHGRLVARGVPRAPRRTSAWARSMQPDQSSASADAGHTARFTPVDRRGPGLGRDCATRRRTSCVERHPVPPVDDRPIGGPGAVLSAAP